MTRCLTYVVPLLLAVASSARAQDFGREWMDRVTHQLEQDRAPLKAEPFDLRVFAGERIYYDDNVYLTDTNEKDDTIFVTFGNLRLNYVETNFDAALDLQANYNLYVHEDDASDDEERLYGRARWAGSSVQVEVAQIFRRESDPFIDPVVVERIERIVSNTVPRVTVWATKVLSFEASGDIQFVKFDDEMFEGMDNINYRAGLLGAYELPRGIQIVADGGYIGIDYSNDPMDTPSPGQPDAEGGYARVGFRGDLQERLYMSVLAGATRLRSESDSAAGIKANRETTGDVAAHMRFEASQRLTLFGDFSRRLSWGGWASFVTVNRAMGGLEFAATEKLKITARGQYDYVIYNDDTPGSIDYVREYGTVSGGLNYAVFDNLILEGSATWRQGKVQDTNLDFWNTIVSVGAALTF